LFTLVVNAARVRWDGLRVALHLQLLPGRCLHSGEMSDASSLAILLSANSERIILGVVDNVDYSRSCCLRAHVAMWLCNVQTPTVTWRM